MNTDSSELVSIPRAELDGLRAELRRLRRDAARRVARERIETGTDSDANAPTMTREQLAAWGINE